MEGTVWLLKWLMLMLLGRFKLPVLCFSGIESVIITWMGKRTSFGFWFTVFAC